MMTHATIRRNIVELLADSDSVLQHCTANHGKGCQVYLESFGIEGWPTEADAPYIIVYSDGDNDLAGHIEQATFEVVIQVGVLSKTADAGGLDEEAVSTRTASSNGLVVRHGIAAAEELLELALIEISSGFVGSTIERVSRTSQGTTEHPLHWAQARIAFIDTLVL